MSRRQGNGDSALSSVAVKAAGHVKEDHGSIVYSLSWSADVVSIPQGGGDGEDTSNKRFRYLATCSTRRIYIYQVEIGREHEGQSRSGRMQLAQAYEDEDEEEAYYVCAFGARSRIPYSSKAGTPGIVADRVTGLYPETKSHKGKNRKRPDKMQRVDDDEYYSTIHQRAAEERSYGGEQLLCVAGHCRTIKVVDTMSARGIVMELKGHGDEVWDLKFSPADEWLLASASKDQSIRMWNLKTGSCIAILTGHEGHRDSPVCMSWHISGDRIATSGADTFVKIWDVGEGSPVRQAQLASHQAAEKFFQPQGSAAEIRVTKPVFVQFPIFSAHLLHAHCVDCIRFVGDMLISKSLEGKLILWCPDVPDPPPTTCFATPLHPPPSKIKVVRVWKYKDGIICYVPFVVDCWHKFLLVSNSRGEIFVWEIGAQSLKPIETIALPTQDMTVFRSMAFCPEGETLVAGADNGTVWKWEFPAHERGARAAASKEDSTQ